MSSIKKVKKPRSNFLIFCDEKRPIIRAKNSELKSTEVIQECAKLWKSLTDDEKSVYTKQYEVLKKAHYEAHPKETKVKKKSTRPKSAYINFCCLSREAVKKENPEANPKDLMKKIAEKWTALSDDEKLTYKISAISVADDGCEETKKDCSEETKEAKKDCIEETKEAKKKPARRTRKKAKEPVLED